MYLDTLRVVELSNNVPTWDLVTVSDSYLLSAMSLRNANGTLAHTYTSSVTTEGPNDTTSAQNESVPVLSGSDSEAAHRNRFFPRIISKI